MARRRWPGASVELTEGLSFVPPEGYAVPPDALRRLLSILVEAANHREQPAAG